MCICNCRRCELLPRANKFPHNHGVRAMSSDSTDTATRSGVVVGCCVFGALKTMIPLTCIAKCFTVSASDLNTACAESRACEPTAEVRTRMCQQSLLLTGATTGNLDGRGDSNIPHRREL